RPRARSLGPSPASAPHVAAAGECPMTTVVFVDTETTRLDDDGEVWEIGAIVREPDHPDVRHRYLVRPQRMHRADPEALAIGRFHERTDHITEVLRGAVANLAEPGVPEAW